jgi:hypothetical protein
LDDPREPWRGEADDEWLSTHRGETFATLRSYLRPFIGTQIGDALSRSEIAGVLLSPPRNPPLGRPSRTEQVRYAEQHYAYTTIQVDLALCRICGSRLLERHRVWFVRGNGLRRTIGEVRMCRSCQADSWMFHSRMLSAEDARARGVKVVL